VTPERHTDPSYDQPAQKWWMPTWLRVLWGVGLLLLVLLAGIAGGMVVERQRYDNRIVLDSSWRELAEVIDFLESDSYYRPDENDAFEQWQSELERRAIDAMLQSSGDAYAAFLPPDEATASAERLSGEYEGIGVSVGEGEAGRIDVVSVMIDSPADLADVRVGDTVTEVESTPIPTGDLDLAVSLLRGDAGTSVSVTFQRPNASAFTLNLERERIATGVKTVGYQYFSEQGIAVIQIALFAATTTDELDKALALARDDHADRLLLDLRGNPGGWVFEAQRVIGRFVEPEAGPALLEDTWPADDGMVDVPIVNDNAAPYDGELVVLVDENTASAAEIVAAALQDHNRATIAGARTFGKGSVQRVYDFASGDSLRLTVAEWFTPDRARLQGVGVVPDVVVATDSPVDQLIEREELLFERSTSVQANSTPVVATPAR
jgi:carboxyl-terminal processing protease